MAVYTIARRRLIEQALNLLRRPFRRLMIRRARAEPYNRQIRHDVDRRAAIDRADIERHAAELVVQAFKADHELRRRFDGAAAFLLGAARMRRAPVQHDVEHRRALAPARHRAGLHRRLIGHADQRAGRGRAAKRFAAGEITDLFIRGQNNTVAEPILQASRFKRFQRFEHHADAALHVRHAGPVDRAVSPVRHRLKNAGRKHRVVMAGHDDLHRRLRTRGDFDDRPGMRFRHFAIGPDGFESRPLHQPDVRLKGRECVSQLRREPLEPVRVQAAGIVRRPGARALQHSRRTGIQALARGFIIGGKRRKVCHGPLGFTAGTGRQALAAKPQNKNGPANCRAV